MANDLALPDDLEGFPGAPFSDEVVDSACAGLRSIAGWHIAPLVTETLTLDATGDTKIVLPTLQLAEVTAVRDVCSDVPVAITDFRWSRVGVLYRRCGWPRGFQTLEVDIIHGYERCPAELLPAIAEACQVMGIEGNVAARSAGPFTTTYRDRAGQVADPAVARYTLPSRA